MHATIATPAHVHAVSLDTIAANATRHLFLTGKGGVGKTTVASALALRLAERGRPTLLVSTDPASNLDDVFAMTVGETPAPVPGTGEVPGAAQLFVMNLDPVREAALYRERMVAPYRGALPESALRALEEQLSGACTVEIAAFNAFTALLADPALARYAHIVFDTAPTGHTLRLLTLPSAWTGFIATSSSGTSCLGPLAGLEGQRQQYADAMSALADGDRTTLVLVTRAESSALREAARASAELAVLGMHEQRLVVNGLLAHAGEDEVGAAFVDRQRAALAMLPEALATLPTVELPLLASELTGLDALREIGQATFEGASVDIVPLRHDEAHVHGFRDWENLVQELAQPGHGVIMTMGKGGVGKTTMAARLARALADAGYRVHLTTTDPAAHVERAVSGAGHRHPPTLTVSRIDPLAETTRYATEVIEEAECAAGGLEPEERALLEEDLRSPCTEEIAIFRAFARTVAEAADHFVVLDTAPTGHTLLLLDAAESYHREVARTAGSHIPEAVRALLPRLRDAAFTRMLIVTLAEATPVHEAERLQADLARADIAPFGWIVNASLAASGTAHPVLATRARLELRHLARVRDELALRAWLVPWEPAVA
jgi:arsenite/tail-anchored protein-transporting ATPase